MLPGYSCSRVFNSTCSADSVAQNCWGLRRSQVLRAGLISPSPGEVTAFSCTQELLGNDLEQPETGKESEGPLTVFLSEVTGLQVAMIPVFGMIPILIFQIGSPALTGKN